MSKYIGVFDSGVGGLTVVKALLDKYPHENIIYLGDTRNMPYGSKTNDEIIHYVKDAVKFLNNFDLKTIVIACNTADSVASEMVKRMYSIPVYGVIDPASRVAVNTTKNKKIGVIATVAAINTNKYERNIHKYDKSIEVYSQPCKFLAPLIEQGKFDIGNQEARDMIKDYCDPIIAKGIDTLILGCTHYDLIEEIVNDMYPNIKTVSSSKCVIEDIENNIPMEDHMFSEQEYYVSSDPIGFKRIIYNFMGDLNIKLIYK